MCPYALKQDPESGLWLSEKTALSAALLERPAQELGVRPPDQPLPPHLAGSGLGRLFGHWLRQRDDPARTRPKAALARALAALPSDAIAAAAQRQAALAWAGGWDHWVWATPAGSVAALLGLPLDDLDAQKRLRVQLQALAQGLAAGASEAAVAAADRACAALLDALRDPSAATTPLQAALVREAPPGVWGSVEGFEANRLALLWQSYEAGAALLGNALAALAADPALRRAAQLHAWLPALLRAGGAVLNTRRFAQAELRCGDAVLPRGAALRLNLADPDAEGAEDELGFGAGSHRCPGQDLALGTAAAALEWLLATAPDWPRPRDVLVLPNARIPLFDRSSEEPQP